MVPYLIRRLFLTIPTVWITTVIVFLLMRAIPGDVIEAITSDLASVGGGISIQQQRDSLRKELGLDAPLLTQYGRWMGVVRQADGHLSGLLQGDFGTSLWERVPVTKLIAPRLPTTFELALMAIVVGQLIGLPIGVYAALRQDSATDYLARSFSVFCNAIPGFWLGTLIVVLPSIWWNWSPSIFVIPFSADPMGNLVMFIIPATVLGMNMSGASMRLTRTMMLEVFRQDYIRTAWAKGLRERTVVIRHALKNALIPVITLVGLQMPAVVGGAVIIENIFSLPGMGQLGLQALSRRDYPIVSATLLIGAVAVVFTNLVVDIAYHFLDPRVHYQ